MEAIKQVYEFMENANVYYLATVENNQPRVRVYGTVLLYEDKLYIMALRQTNAVSQLQQNPKAEICAFKRKQLRLTCELQEDPRQEVKDAMMEKMPSLKAATGEKYSGAVMYQVTNATATIADMTGKGDRYSF